MLVVVLLRVLMMGMAGMVVGCMEHVGGVVADRRRDAGGGGSGVGRGGGGMVRRRRRRLGCSVVAEGEHVEGGGSRAVQHSASGSLNQSLCHQHVSIYLYHCRELVTSRRRRLSLWIKSLGAVVGSLLSLFGFDLRNITMSIPRSGIGLREESVWKTKTIDQVLVKSGSV